jgi:aspartyl-tRNA synthetase
MLRTHTAGELRIENEGAKVSLCGWVASRRDHKGTIFVDLRDRYGLTQLVFRRGEGDDALVMERGSELPLETCVQVSGEVNARPEGLRNPKMPTGDIEVLVNGLAVLGPAETPPFELEVDDEASDELRMKYRYLDLRRKRMTSLLVLRHRVTTLLRNWFSERDFVDVETPMLTKSTPEGARDYLVPSREHAGAFYALPQSPQLFKQLLMVAGLDRYFQIARCFRDEDLRADRQPEFTQLDVEMSFVTEEDVYEVLEELTAILLREFCGHEIERPMLRMTFEQAMAEYGSDRPDLRFGLKIHDLTESLANSAFRAFSQTAAAGGRIRGLRVPEGATLSRKQLSGLEDVARENGGKGLVWLKVGEDLAFTGPAAKFLGDEERGALLSGLSAAAGDLLLVAADKEAVVAKALGAVRLELSRILDLVEKGSWSPLFVVDWPLFEFNEEEGRFDALHHPFTSPVEEDLDLLESDPGAVRSRAYDLVVNGVELGGGSIRIHNPEVQQRVLRTLGISEEAANEKFGFLLNALRYGAPPHGGFALGMDRLVALLAGIDSMREVIAFPKTTSAACLLTGAPAEVSAAQWKELGLAKGG